MCNSSKKKKEESVSTEKISKKTHDKHLALTPPESLKLVNHEIEVKGDVEFPLHLSVDSLKKKKLLRLTILK
jgi:DMSO/TMAO reductase YedYZ molybdopterin-dependent catalytic subunit